MTAYQVAELTASTQGHHRCASHTQIGRCRMCSSQQMLNELAIIFEVTGRCFTAWFTAPRSRAGFIGRRARSWICLLVSPRSSQRPAGPPFRRALPWPPSVECGAAGPASWASFYRNHNSPPSRFKGSLECLATANKGTVGLRSVFTVRKDRPILH